MPEEVVANVALDTNVLLDLYSCHDLTNAYENGGMESLGSDDATWRRQRARDALLLAMVFHRHGTIAYYLQREFLAIIKSKVPIDDTASHLMHYVSVFHRLLQRALPDWHQCIDDVGDTVRGDDADTHLLNHTIEHRIPLITNEGFGPGRIRDRKLRARAIEAGVEVFTPREYFEGQIDEQRESKRFLKRMSAAVPEFMRGQPRPDVAIDSVRMVLAYLRHVLYGETAHHGTVPVHLAVTRSRRG